MHWERARKLAALAAVITMLALAGACGGDDDDLDEDEGAETTAAATTPYRPSGNEGSLTGTVTFTGAPPAPKSVSMDTDPVCASTNPNAKAEDIVINGDKLLNVFVYVKDGKTADGKSITGFSFEAPSQPAVLDQKGCQYTPHVVGVVARQPLNVLNSDNTSHNVNVQAAKNEKFNQGQGPGAAPITKAFNRPETLIPVKCNQHPWMKAYIGVLAHPFFGVSGPDGKFEIKGLPPGTYNVVAWHEKYPQGITQSVTVGAKEIKEQNFSFNDGQLKADLVGGALEILPALELPMLAGHNH